MTSFLGELWEFMRERKKFWLAPIIIMLLLLGGLIVFENVFENGGVQDKVGPTLKGVHVGTVDAADSPVRQVTETALGLVLQSLRYAQTPTSGLSFGSAFGHPLLRPLLRAL